ncbi:MAG: hypothetical protein LBQ52_09565 [Helicobacteraceae bacterium]|jgi:hypothetical protein|nr:hypothetical protein [Helicobacteraceae bacterium]
MSADEKFAKDYIEAWSVKDDETRKNLVSKLYADNATFYAREPNDDPVKCYQVAEIAANITQVNERLAQGAGLITQSAGFSVNRDTIKVAWKMNTPEGKTALRGMNILQRDETGRILRDYIFIG